MPRPRLNTECGHTLCASLRCREPCPHVTREIRRMTGKCCGPDWAQNADTHLARACAIKMRVHMSQETSQEQHYLKCRRTNWAENTDKRFVRACAVETHIKISQESLGTQICRQNAAGHSEQAPWASKEPRFGRNRWTDEIFEKWDRLFFLPC